MNSYPTFYCAGEAEVQIHITDKNDNTPYFKEKVYYASVPENTDMGQAIITVTAEDNDEGRKTLETFIDFTLRSGEDFKWVELSL